MRCSRRSGERDDEHDDVTESSVWPQKCMYPMMLMMMRQRQRQTMSTAQMSRIAMITTMPPSWTRCYASPRGDGLVLLVREPRVEQTRCRRRCRNCLDKSRSQPIDLTLSSDL